MYEEIQELYEYCLEIGIKATLTPLYDGHKICFNNGGSFVQHQDSYRSDDGYVEVSIGCKFDNLGMMPKNAKALARYHKDRLNKKGKKK